MVHSNRLRLKASGQTKLYDTVRVCCNMLLEIAATMKIGEHITQQDFGTFWLVMI